MVITDPSAVRTRAKVTRGRPDRSLALVASVRWVASRFAVPRGSALAFSATGCAALHAAARTATQSRPAASRTRLRWVTVTGPSCPRTVKPA